MLKKYLFLVPFFINTALCEVLFLLPEELLKHADDFIILDAREKDFEDGHIPKSVHFRWDDYTEEKRTTVNSIFGNPSQWGKVITDTARIESTLSGLGISNNSKVVIVGQPNAWGTEGRVGWNLLYWGLEKVYLLNGGFQGWKNQKYPIHKKDTLAKQVKPGHFVVRFDQDRRILKAELEKKLTTYKLIDNRTSAEFLGEEQWGQKRAGHIPKAENIPAASLYKSDGYFISKEDFIKFNPPTKVTKVAYCVGGIRSALYVLLHEAYFKKKVLNYDGSLWEWAAENRLPLEKR